MAKTSEATLKAIKKYNQKSKFINIKYTQNSISDYERVCQYCNDNNLSLQGYIKALIKRDLDSKGFMINGNIDIGNNNDNMPIDTSAQDTHNNKVDT